MRAHHHLDEGVASLAAAETRHAFAFQAQDLPFVDAGGDTDVERAAVRQGDALLRALHRFEKIDLETILRV